MRTQSPLQTTTGHTPGLRVCAESGACLCGGSGRWGGWGCWLWTQGLLWAGHRDSLGQSRAGACVLIRTTVVTRAPSWWSCSVTSACPWGGLALLWAQGIERLIHVWGLHAGHGTVSPAVQWGLLGVKGAKGCPLCFASPSICSGCWGDRDTSQSSWIPVLPQPHSLGPAWGLLLSPRHVVRGP